MNDTNTAFRYTEYPLARGGIALHLDRIALAGCEARKQILLIHGVTYSSHEFDLDYADYSLARRLAREGWGDWRLDIAGYGRSGRVADGFLPDSDYAAEDIRAAVDTIVRETGAEKIDLLGWSWGTVTSGRFAARHPEHLRRLVLYAPILSGIGESEITEPFHRNTWEHAAEDFQRDASGRFDEAVTDPVVRELWCSACWHYDGEASPNGGRRDICVSPDRSLIPLGEIRVPTLILCGDRDPYLNYARIEAAPASLPEGSALEILKGAGHCALVEKPFYRDFQDRLVCFLRRDG